MQQACTAGPVHSQNSSLGSSICLAGAALAVQAVQHWASDSGGICSGGGLEAAVAATIAAVATVSAAQAATVAAAVVLACFQEYSSFCGRASGVEPAAQVAGL